MEEHVGSIEVGKAAYLAVRDSNLCNVTPGDVKEMHCEKTLVDREIVYAAPRECAPRARHERGLFRARGALLRQRLHRVTLTKNTSPTPLRGSGSRCCWPSARITVTV